MKENFLISTGGSGGHVLPAITLCEHLSKEANLLISTDKRGLKYFDSESYRFEIIDTPKLNNIFFLPFNLIKVLFLTVKSVNLLKDEKIKKVFSIGGYMSLPLILASRLLRLKIYLIEPNQVLGRANKYFLRSCKKIFCYTKSVKNFPDNFKNKIVTINPLVRKYIYNLKISNEVNNKLTLIIVGGSQGANIFDKNLKNSIVNIKKKKSIKVIQQTNEKNISFLRNFYAKNKIENKIFSFDQNLFYSLKQSDLCITRAGASTLSELSVMNIPFIAIPLPTSSDNHQFENANYYKNNGCCWMIEQDSFEEKIENLLKDIINNESDYLEKRENLKKLNYQNTWNNVNQKILDNIYEN